MHRGKLLLLLACVAAVGLSSPASGANITPNILGDEDVNNGDCSLREAVTAANTDGVYNGCNAGSDDGFDTIIMQEGSFYNLTIPGADDSNAQGDLDVQNESLLIQSNGPGLAVIDANGATTGDRAFHYISGTSFSLDGIQLMDGDETGGGGGALKVESTGGIVSISDSRLTDNETTGDGGAIFYESPSLSSSITNTTIDANSASNAAGVYVQGSGGFLINRSTINGNVATSPIAAGGGLGIGGGTTSLVNSTVSGNQSPGTGAGVFVLGATVNINNSTIANNTVDTDNNGGDGGGISVGSGTVNTQNSIFADNTDVSGGAPDCNGTVVSGGHNLIESTLGCSGFTGTGDVTGMDPGLGPLLPTSGTTSTHRLIGPGSPAINAGDPASPGSGGTACNANDQRNLSRASSPGNCDIGAYELQNEAPVLAVVGNKTVQAGSNLAFNLSAVDPNPGQTVTFSGTLPPGADLSPSGAFSWTPTAGQAGLYPSVDLIASDGFASDTETISITVTPGPTPTGGGSTAITAPITPPTVTPVVTPPKKTKCKKRKGKTGKGGFQKKCRRGKK